MPLASLDLLRPLRIALFIHHVGVEAVDIIGETSPRRRATCEDMRVGLYPSGIVVSAGVNDLKRGKPLQGYTEARAAS